MAKVNVVVAADPVKPTASAPVKVAELPLVSVLEAKKMAKARALLEELEVLKMEMGIAKERWEEAEEELAKMQREAGVPGLRWGRLAFYEKQMEGRRTLSAELLVEQGVAADVVARSYKTGKPYVQKNFEVIK